jgi:radical SAM superfamily enzyme YgiQ (UPF0313 family)
MNPLKRACDFLIINPPSPDGHVYIRDVNRSGRRSRERSIWPQNSLAYLASVAGELHYQPNVLDCIASDFTWNQINDYIKRFLPKWIIVEGISSTITNDIYAAYLGKRYGAKTVLIGPHITALPEATMKAFPVLDFGILGEVEGTLKELVFKADNDIPISDVKGIVYRKNNFEISNTGVRPFIENLDALPMAKQELLPLEKYKAPYIGGPYTFVLHSRGCPNACAFCRQNVMWKSVCRLRSGKSIAEEFRYLASLGVKRVMFHSDTFTQNRDNVLDICNNLIDGDFGIEWICNARVDLVDEEILAAMKKAGCFMVNLGIESGVQKLLDNANKGENATVENARKSVAMVKAAGIKVWAYFIIGLPGESRETIKATSRFSKELPADLVNFSVATPYPGTPFYKTAKANGWLKNVDWEDFDQNYSAVVSYPQLSDKEIIKGVKFCYLRWYGTPRGIKIFLRGLTSLENVKTMFRIAYDHVRIS